MELKRYLNEFKEMQWNYIVKQVKCSLIVVNEDLLVNFNAQHEQFSVISIPWFKDNKRPDHQR